MSKLTEPTRIYNSMTLHESALMDAVIALEGILSRDELEALLSKQHGLNLLELATMATEKGMDYVYSYCARLDRLDEFFAGYDDEWESLYDELTAEREQFTHKVPEGMRYSASCPYCNGKVISESDKDLAGRVVGMYCNDCGTAFYTRVPRGYGKTTLRKTSDILQEAILKVLTGEELPATIRHIFYVLAGHGYVTKNDKGYEKVLYQLGVMRDYGQVPYDWLADNTRWHIRPRTYSNLESALINTTETYRRALWDTQKVYVEIWCEKDAVASIIASVTRAYDVPLFVARGFSSTTPLYNIAEEIKELGKPAFIYQFGDFDPSGVLAFDAAAKKLQEFVSKFGGQVTLERVTVTEKQITDWNLPTRETKKSTHTKKWGNRPSCELDVIPSSKLRELARDCIEQHIDQGELGRIKQIEQEEQKTLQAMLANFRLGRNSEVVQG